MILQETLRTPVAKIVPKTMEVHGDSRVDNYFWLRDRNDPDTIRYLEEENAFLKATLKHTEALQSQIYDEILSHIKQTDLTVPTKRDNYFYYLRTEEGKQYPIYCQKKDPSTGRKKFCSTAMQWPRARNISASEIFRAVQITNCWPIRWISKATKSTPFG